MRQIYFYICGIICFTALLRRLGRLFPISPRRRASPRRSSTRNNVRSPERRMNGSGAAISVQSSGTEDLRPLGLKKKTRHSPGNRLTSTVSSSISLYGWNGWVIRKVLCPRSCWDAVKKLCGRKIRVSQNHLTDNLYWHS